MSPTYAREIQTPEYGFGMDGALRARADVLTGILNGVDYREWSPDVDPLIPAHYSADDLAGKRICKEAPAAASSACRRRRWTGRCSASCRALPARRAPT